MAFLDREKFRDLTRQQITSRLRDLGGGQQFFNLRGRGVNTFWLPNIFDAQTEPHATPARQEAGI
jgi:hypothetical protein